MKREFLTNLGIEDKDIINKILDENSADIGRAKGELDSYKTRVTTLEGQLGEKDTEISTLKTQVGDVEKLNDRITQLETDKSNLTNQLNTEVSKLQKTHAIEASVRDAKAKNVKAVLGLLDMDKITYENGELTGISEQLETLKSGEDTGFLFGEKETSPSGTHVNNPIPGSNGGNPSTGKSFAEAVAQALSK